MIELGGGKAGRSAQRELERRRARDGARRRQRWGLWLAVTLATPGGERRTACDLDRLGPGYHVLHDLRLPGSRANIDHLVIGPTGVFTVETKHRKAPVVVGRRGVTGAGRTMRPAVDQARRQATAVSTALGVAVRPVVAIQGGRLEVRGWRTRPIVDGVRFCTGRHLAKVLSAGPACLTADQVAAFHHRASATFAPA
jgi:hypothetical protein